MGHDHHHSHDSTKQIGSAFFLNLCFTLIEIAGAYLTNSVAILSDAIHDLGDSLSLGLAWLLERISRKNRDDRFSYGYRRFSLLGALINVLVLLGGSVVVIMRALPRLVSPEATHAPGMLGLAILGIAANGLAVLRLKGARSANSRVVMLHLLEDVLGWAAVLLVSVVLLFTQWYILDALLSLAITIWILINVIKHLRRTLRLFLQGVPDSVSIDELKAQIQLLHAVESVHHLHAWSLDGDHHVLTAHVVLAPETDRNGILAIKAAINDLVLPHHFVHTTLEIEFADEPCHNAADCQ